MINNYKVSMKDGIEKKEREMIIFLYFCSRELVKVHHDKPHMHFLLVDKLINISILLFVGLSIS